MPLIAKVGDFTQGHCWPPAPMVSQKNGSVHVDGALAIVEGDKTVHLPGCTTPPSTHDVIAIQGSPTVFAGGIPIVRDGDPMGCGDAAETPGGTVYANGGGNFLQVVPGGDPGANVGEQVGYVVVGTSVTYNVVLRGRIVRTSLGPTAFKETWSGWRPDALQPKSSNGFRVTLQEEFTGRRYTSIQSQGAANIPATAPPIYQQPLDPFVRFEMISGPFTIDNAGAITLIPSFIPPEQEHTGESTLFVRSIPVSVRFIYGEASSIIAKDVNFDVQFALSTDP